MSAWISRVLSTRRKTINGAPVIDVKADPGGGALHTSNQFSAPGDDALPLADDYALDVALARTGGVATVGYSDSKNTGQAGAGEKRIYARDSSGAVVAEVFLHGDGEVEAKNGAASITLAPDGTVTIGNSASSITFDPSGNITLTGAGFDWVSS